VSTLESYESSTQEPAEAADPKQLALHYFISTTSPSPEPAAELPDEACGSVGNGRYAGGGSAVSAAPEPGDRHPNCPPEVWPLQASALIQSGRSGNACRGDDCAIRREHFVKGKTINKEPRDFPEHNSQGLAVRRDIVRVRTDRQMRPKISLSKSCWKTMQPGLPASS
jgi:hypothetical protein